MRPTKLVAASSESFADATIKLINKVIGLSGPVQNLHIMEDTSLTGGAQYNVKAHILRRK